MAQFAVATDKLSPACHVHAKVIAEYRQPVQFLLKNEMVEAIVCIPPSPEQSQGGLVVHLRIQVIPGDAFGLLV